MISAEDSGPIGKSHERIIGDGRYGRIVMPSALKGFRQKTTSVGETPAAKQGVAVADMLKDVFGHDSFRPGQHELIDALLGREDVIFIAPTSLGKSLPHQLVSLMNAKMDPSFVCIVICPTISLIEDQYRRATEITEKMGMNAFYLHSEMEEGDRRAQFEKISASNSTPCPIWILSPERFVSQSFWRKVGDAAGDREFQIATLVIDEAHLIQQWAFSFRAAYGLKLGQVIRSFPEKPNIAILSATLLPTAEEAAKEFLGIENPKKITLSADRSNLKFSRREFTSLREQIQALGRERLEFNAREGAGSTKSPWIVYCSTRREVKIIAAALANMNLVVGQYHGKLDYEERIETQRAFTNGEIDLIIATDSFGMGIDYGRVRRVIHTSHPRDLTTYIQQSGRAGRDGLEARCEHWVREADLTQLWMVENANPTRDSILSFYQRLFDKLSEDQRQLVSHAGTGEKVFSVERLFPEEGPRARFTAALRARFSFLQNIGALSVEPRGNQFIKVAFNMTPTQLDEILPDNDWFKVKREAELLAFYDVLYFAGFATNAERKEVLKQHLAGESLDYELIDIFKLPKLVSGGILKVLDKMGSATFKRLTDEVNAEVSASGRAAYYSWEIRSYLDLLAKMGFISFANPGVRIEAEGIKQLDKWFPTRSKSPKPSSWEELAKRPRHPDCMELIRNALSGMKEELDRVSGDEAYRKFTELFLVKNFYVTFSSARGITATGEQILKLYYPRMRAGKEGSRIQELFAQIFSCRKGS